MKSFRLSIKAVSPVIATIIIVAIAIVMSIAVAYWMLGLGAAFTKYEKVEFTSAYADTVVTPAPGYFRIYMDMKNTGSAAATIDTSYTLYNGKPRTAAAYTAAAPIITGFPTTTLDPGKSVTAVYIDLPKTGVPATEVWTSGMTVELTIHTTAGKDYPKVIVLP